MTFLQNEILRGNRDEYQIERELGKGTFGVVYLAKRVSDHMIVALKEFRTPLVDDEHADREIRILQRLNHKNIVKYFDKGSHEGKLF